MMIRQSVFLLVLSIFWVACADYNSSTSDDLEYVETTANDADPNFLRAFEIIKNRCADCHNPSDRHSEWYSYNTNAKWIKSGLVVKGDVDKSSLITKTYLYGAGGSMPQENDLSPEEYEDLKTWINEMP
jgi:hypothetical protein